MKEITKEEMREAKKPYFLASWEDDQLVLEPYCYCGQMLDEGFYCSECGQNCSIEVILCKEFKVVGIVEKFLHGNPQFRNFEAYLLKSSEGL